MAPACAVCNPEILFRKKKKKKKKSMHVTRSLYSCLLLFALNLS